MNKKISKIKLAINRKVLVFFIFLVTLGILAPIIIFYSLGYRFDSKVGIFIYSGTVVLKPTPFDVEIEVDGKPLAKKQVDIINQSININGLRPGEYEIKVKKSGYKEWNKKTRVRSGVATEFWNISLVPENVVAKEVTEKSIVKSAFSPDKKKLAYFTKENEFLAFYVKGDRGDNLLAKEPVNERFSAEAGEIKWSANNNWVIFSFKRGGEEKIFLSQTDISNPQVISFNNSEKIDFYTWNEKGDLYFLSQNKIMTVSLDDISLWENKNINLNNNLNGNSNSNLNNNLNKNKNLDKKVVETANQNQNSGELTKENSFAKATMIAEKSVGFTFCGDYICSVSGEEKKVKIMTLAGMLLKEINFSPEMNQGSRYQVFAYGEKLLALLDEKNNLFLWDELKNKKLGTEKIDSLGGDVRDVYFSDDGKKLLFKTRNQAIVYFVQDWEVQPKHLAGEKETLCSEGKMLEKVQWFYDYQNVFVATKNEIKLVELDGREGRNLFGFYKTDKEISNFNYDAGEKKIWFLESDGLGGNRLKEIIFPETAGYFSNIIGK